MSDERTIISGIIGGAVAWVSTLVGGGIAYGKILGRVKDLEEKGPCVTPEDCLERRNHILENTGIRFAFGDQQFLEIKKMIGDLERSYRKSHDEIIKAIAETRK